MSQAVYAGYCETFPDSYRQFNDDFKWDLISIVFGWIAGECCRMKINVACSNTTFSDKEMWKGNTFIQSYNLFKSVLSVKET